MSLLLSSHAPRKRLAVLGLDGLPLSLAQTLGASLPNIGRLAKDAVTVRAELPELSPVNWTSFFTGQGPEKHGIYGFSRINPQSYELSVTDRTHIQCPTIFDWLDQSNLVSRVINLPNTYPAKQLHGMLVSGFVSHDIQHAAYPPFLAGKLADIGYKLEADTNRGASDLDYLLEELRHTLASRLAALDILWTDLAWDLFIHVFTETDRLFHFFMDAVLHHEHVQHRKCMQFLADWDAAIGQFLKRYDALPGPKRLMVLADHGFTELKTEVCINTWLKKQGLLSLSHQPNNEWDATAISSDSTAFALDPGRVYIHTHGRFSRGHVQQAEKASLMTSIKNGLMDLSLDGTPVMKYVYTSDELYPDANSDQLPDLICQAHLGFDLKAKFDRDTIFGLHGRTGTHTVEGAIYYDSEGWVPTSMRDTGKAILQYFNLSDQ